jgi:flagellar basal-body rod protein FlgC
LEIELGHQQTFAISAAAMDIERTRVDVASANLAHAQTALAPNESAPWPMRVVVRPSAPAFSNALANASSAPSAAVESASAAPRRTLDPGHPLADDKGFVRYPAVDTAQEMMTLMSAVRAYESNVAAINASRAMAMKALDIGGAQ